MVAKQVLHRHVLRNRVLAHGNSRRAREVVLRHLAALLLEVAAHEQDRPRPISRAPRPYRKAKLAQLATLALSLAL